MNWWPNGAIRSGIGFIDFQDVGSWSPGVFTKAEVVWDLSAGGYDVIVDDVNLVTHPVPQPTADPGFFHTGSAAEFFDDDVRLTISYVPNDVNADGFDDCVGFEEIQTIINYVLSIQDLDGGTSNALVSKLENTLAKLANGHVNAAINELEAFINQVEAQSGKKLDATDAQTLVDMAQAVIDQLPV